jgi:hypothetical protein
VKELSLAKIFSSTTPFAVEKKFAGKFFDDVCGDPPSNQYQSNI